MVTKRYRYQYMMKGKNVTPHFKHKIEILV